MVFKKIGKVLDNLADTAMASGKLGAKIAAPLVKVGYKGAVNLGNKAFDGIESIAKHNMKELASSAKSTIKKIGSATVDNILTNDESYKEIGKTGIKVSKKLNLLDEVQTHTRAAGNMAYKIGRGKDFKFKGLITGKEREISTRLFRPDDDSLIGLKATRLGKVVMVGGAAMAGVPKAANAAVEGRRGMSDGQSVGHAPNSYVPAYQQNAGATGDLVFALNNLRRG